MQMTSVTPFQLKNGLSLALKSVLFGTMLGGINHAVLAADTQLTMAKTQHIQIGAGSLDQALAQFAGQTGTELSYDPTLVSGKKTEGLSGPYTFEQGIHQLLKGTGLTLIKRQDGTWGIIDANNQLREVGQLPSINSTASNSINNDQVAQLPIITLAAEERDGKAQNGYRVKKLKQVGPWGEKSLQDTPYSMSVMPSDLIENVVAGDMDQIYKMNPVIQNSAPSTVYGTPYAAIRGFHTQSGIMDGLRLSSTSTGIAMEELDRVEIMNGLTGFMYGVGNVGGTTNYVLKRPVYEKQANMTLGNYGNQQWFAHVDLGNKIDEQGVFAYRLNVSHQNGETSKDGQNIERTLVSGALDWHVSDKLLLQLEAAHTDYKLDGIDSRFYAYANSSYGALNYWIDPLKNDKTYTPPWTYLDIQTDRIGLNTTYNINDIFTLRSAYLYKVDRSESKGMYPAYFADSGWKSGWNYYNAPAWNIAQGLYTYLDSQFNTGGIAHKLTIGISGDTLQTRKYQNGSVSGANSTAYATAAEVEDYVANDLIINDLGNKYTSAKSLNSNVIIGDDIKFNDQWNALIGLNYTTIKTKNFNTSGATSSSYSESKLTPTVSILYKLIPELTTYVSYMEGLEKGSTVSSDAKYNEPGKLLPPTMSKQYELGAKYSISDRLLLSSAIFRIEKANTYETTLSNGKIDVNQDGLQVHQGLELMLTGKLTDGLTVMTGGTWMDLSIEKATNAALEGKEPTGAAHVLAKIYVEYELPSIEGLSLTAGAYHSGSMYKDSANLQKLDSYTIFDIGARYKTIIHSVPTTFNLNVSNLTDKDYWATTYSLGIPRNIAFSVKTEF